MPTTAFTAVKWNIFTVPARVTSLTVTLDGAGSGARPGGRVTGKLAVYPGQRLYCVVGGAGKANAGATAGAATFGAGAAGGTGRGKDGGDSGGGYSCIRIGSTSGTIKAFAGGAGGDSGDGGIGGSGGGTTGGSGKKAGTGDLTGVSTGGTQVQGGNGGTSPAGAAYNGFNAPDTTAAAAGKGGTAATTVVSHGGGGGGGGYKGGGGGQASAVGYAPGGGGAGGSSYTGGLTGAANTQGGGGTGNGGVTITWVTPPPGNIPPVVPTAVKVNNVDATSGMLTKATTKVRITATIFDPDKQKVRLLVRYSTKSTFSPKTDKFSGWTTWAATGRAVNVDLTGLSQNTHYYVRLYAQDSKGMYSTGYNSIDFWTNKAPLPPTDQRINGLSEGMTLPVLSSGTFGWTHNDEDYADYQSGFQIQYRTSATSAKPAGAWTTITQYPGTLTNLAPKVAGPPSSSHNEWVFNPGTFKGNTFYEWQVRTRDGQGLWGTFSTLFTFYSSSTTTPPILVSPANNAVVDVHQESTFRWRFVDPEVGDTQARADIRYRVIGATKEVTSGVPTTPGDWVVPPTGQPKVVRTLTKLTHGTGSQDFCISTDGTWFLSHNNNPPQEYPVEDNMIRRLNANGTVRDSMIVKEIGHGMPVRAEVVSGTTYITLAYYKRPAPSYFQKFVRLPYVPGKTYTLAEAETFPTTQWPGTAYPPVPPPTNPYPLQGFNYDGDTVFRLYDDLNADPTNQNYLQHGISRIDVIKANVLAGSLYYPSAGYNTNGTVVNGRRESEGLQIVTVAGKKYLYWGVVTGNTEANRAYVIYSIPLPVVSETTGEVEVGAQEGEGGEDYTTGADQFLVVPPDRFVGEYTYEWQVRTYDRVGGLPSDWSTPFRFMAIFTPGKESGALPVGAAVRPQGSLGCGEYRVFAYEQGGQRRLGEITPITKMTFTRVRDDISGCTVFSNGYSSDCGELYAGMRSWMHEIVVYRDGVRVWEGPITRMAYKADEFEVEAKDVMAYVYRRIMRAGYNDSYRLVQKGTAGKPDTYLGLLSVVTRANLLVTQALAPYDPNVLPYLTTLNYPDDARESRIVADWSRSCWEEIDDLAATAGLDYTTVGRRIILWDTHRPIGRLPEMRDGDFSDSPIVTEYGMQLATFFAVTNGSGVVGWTSEQKGMLPYGPVEQLASSYSDSDTGSGEVMTPAAKAAAEAALIDQAKRNIAGRWPAPLIVRIPDNTTLSPKANVGFQQLIPGVWLPLRSVNTPRKVAQWQKLDSVSVEVDDSGEKVHVVLSPAPNGGNDPDSDMAAEAE